MEIKENCPYKTEYCFFKYGEDFTGSRVVVKLGTNTMCQGGTEPDLDFIFDTARQVNCLRRHGVEVALVSSGAVAAGGLRLEELVKKQESNETRKQLKAAKGQPFKFLKWIEAFNKYDIDVFQFLFSDADLKRKRALRSLQAAIKYGVADINGNDPVSVGELRKLSNIPSRSADNDHLAASVALAVRADTLILATDIEGVLDGDQPNSRLIPYIDAGSSLEGLSFFETQKSGIWTGGMASKVREGLRAARESKNSSGCNVFILDGKERDFMLRIISGERIGTRLGKQVPVLV